MQKVEKIITIFIPFIVKFIHVLEQGLSNFFQVGSTFISQNVQRTTLLLSPLKANLLFFKMFWAYVNTSIHIFLK
jgi:hypothetical protein